MNPIGALLEWVPVATSLALGAVFLYAGEAKPAVKLVGVAAFFAAVYLQFFSSHALVGLLLQVAIAFALASWLRADRQG